MGLEGAQQPVKMRNCPYSRNDSAYAHPVRRAPGVPLSVGVLSLVFLRQEAEGDGARRCPAKLLPRIYGYFSRSVNLDSTFCFSVSTVSSYLGDIGTFREVSTHEKIPAHGRERFYPTRRRGTRARGTGRRGTARISSEVRLNSSTKGSHSWPSSRAASSCGRSPFCFAKAKRWGNRTR